MKWVRIANVSVLKRNRLIRKKTKTKQKKYGTTTKLKGG